MSLRVLCLSTALATLSGAAMAQSVTATGDYSPSPATSPNWNLGGAILTIAETGTGTLAIDNGGTVTNGTSLVGIQAGSSGTVTVNGVGSNWSNSGDTHVGFGGTGALNIQGGGAVSSNYGFIGDIAGSDGTVTVTGQNSTWTNSSQLIVGSYGNGTLNILAGGAVSNTTGIIGNIAGGTGAVTVSGVGSIWTNSSGLSVGYFGTGTLTIENGGAVSDINGVVGYYDTSLATVSGAGSTWTHAGTLSVGLYAGGTLNISDGGFVTSVGTYIANDIGTTASVSVDGLNSRLTTSDSLLLGRNGNGSLTISNQGVVEVSNTLVIGQYITGIGTADVTGSGSALHASGYMIVGSQGAGSLTISDGGLVTVAVMLTLGDYASGVGTVTVRGVGSGLTTNSLNVGNQGSGTLTIEDGGTVSNSMAYIRAGIVSVSGAGSLWTNSNSLFVGYFGTNTVEIEDGGALSSSYAYIGFAGTGVVNVTGAGSTWTNSSTLSVGSSGDGTLTVADGGVVSSYYGYIGDSSGSSGTATVTGVGSTWTNTGALRVGYSGAGTLIVADGGVVSSYYGYIGDLSGSSGTATVTGMGSMWTNTGALRVGNSGFGRLIVSDGGTLSSGSGALGYAGGGSGVVIVTGAGSMWTNTGALTVGNSGFGTLIVADGGTVSTPTMELASYLGSGGSVYIGMGDLAGTLNTASIMGGSGNAAVNFNHADFISFAPEMAGHLRVYQYGPGETRLMGANTYDGVTTVGEGVLSAGAAHVFSANSYHYVEPDGTLALRGFSQTIAGLYNAGHVVIGGATPGAVLTVAGDYAGEDGTVYFHTALGNDASASDRLVVTGSTFGVTNVVVRNISGAGAQTVEGIKIIQVDGASDGLFHLQGNYVTEEGQQAVVGGAYAYSLFQNGISTPDDGDWYLRSKRIGGGTLYNPGDPLYESYPQVLSALTSLPTLQQRVGNRYWNGADREGQAGASEGAPDAASSGSTFTQANGLWGRIEGSTGSFDPAVSTVGATRNVDLFLMQAGADLGLYETSDGSKLIGAITGHYGRASATIGSLQGDGTIDATAYGMGATLTWYGANGVYADGQAQYSWFDSDLTSKTAGRTLASGNGGSGYALSLETGRRFALGNGMTLTPQAQLTYSDVRFDSFHDVFGALVRLDDGDSLRARLGLSLDKEQSWADVRGVRSRVHVYGIANIYYEFLDGTQTMVADMDGGNGVAFSQRDERLWGGLGVGGTYNWANDTYAIYGTASIDTALQSATDNYKLKGTAGFRVRW